MGFKVIVVGSVREINRRNVLSLLLDDICQAHDNGSIDPIDNRCTPAKQVICMGVTLFANYVERKHLSNVSPKRMFEARSYLTLIYGLSM
jgi:hypothetical protein